LKYIMLENRIVIGHNLSFVKKKENPATSNQNRVSRNEKSIIQIPR